MYVWSCVAPISISFGSNHAHRKPTINIDPIVTTVAPRVSINARVRSYRSSKHTRDPEVRGPLWTYNDTLWVPCAGVCCGSCAS